MLAEKIYKIQKELEEKRMQRMCKDQPQGVVHPAGCYSTASGTLGQTTHPASPMSPLEYANTLIQSSHTGKFMLLV